MMLRALLAVLALDGGVRAAGKSASAAALATEAAPAATSAQPAGCASDADCSLNGVCSAGACVCDAGWRGSACSQLNLAPADPADGIDGWPRGSSSWGGVAVADPFDAATFHFFYSRFVGGCGLLCWVNASECVHAVGPSAAGPFTDVDVVFGVFCHNVHVRRTPDGTFVMFFIGQDDPGRALACRSPDEACASNFPAALPTDGRQYLTLASAAHPAGPWLPLGRAAFAGRGSGWLGWVSNPSVHFFPNGSALLAFRSKVMPGGAGGAPPVGTEVIGLARAPHWSGPYALLLDAPIVVAHEDPHIWADSRGNLHLLSHGATNHWFAAAGAPDVWTLATTPAYGFNFSYSNGSLATANRRERPQLFFSDDGRMTPLVFTTGVTIRGAAHPSASLTLAQRVLP